MKKSENKGTSIKKLLLNPNDVLNVDPTTKVVYLNGDLITETEVSQLQSEIKALKMFRIWNIYQETVKAKAIEMTMLAPALESDEKKLARLMAGQMMLHNLTIMKQLVETIEKYD